MAICGNLTDISLGDLMSMAGRGSGHLEILRNDSEELCEFDLLENKVIRAWVNGREVGDDLHLRALLTDLIHCTTGEFEFARGPVEDGPFEVLIEEALLSGFSMLDEIKGLKEQFDDSETVFIAVKASCEPCEDMAAFWQEALPELLRGTCARELAYKLGLPLDQVRLKLHKLKAAAVIELRKGWPAKVWPQALDSDTAWINTTLEKEVSLMIKVLGPVLQHGTGHPPNPSRSQEERRGHVSAFPPARRLPFPRRIPTAVATGQKALA